MASTTIRARRIIACLMLAGSIAFSQNRNSGDLPKNPEPAELLLLAEEAPNSANVGEPVYLSLVLRNISSHTVRIQDRSAHLDYQLTLTNEDGREPQKTAYALSERAFTRNVSLDLRPAEEIHSIFEVTKFYELPAGRYSGRIERIGISGGTETGPLGRTLSNPIEFLIGITNDRNKAKASGAPEKAALRSQYASVAELQVRPVPASLAVTLHEPVLIDLEMLNMSNLTLHLDLAQESEMDYRVRVTRPDGRIISSLWPRWSREGGHLSSSEPVSLAPGQAAQRVTLLNEWVTFDEVGKYTVSISIPHAISPAIAEVTVDPYLPRRLQAISEDLGARAQTSNIAMRALSYLTDDSAVSQLEALATRTQNPVAIEGLVRVGSPLSVEALAALFRGGDARVSQSAARALLRVSESPGDKALAARAKDALASSR